MLIALATIVLVVYVVVTEAQVQVPLASNINNHVRNDLHWQNAGNGKGSELSTSTSTVLGTTLLAQVVTKSPPWPTPRGYPRASLKEVRILGETTTATFATVDTTVFLLPSLRAGANDKHAWIIDLQTVTYAMGDKQWIIYETPVLATQSEIGRAHV